MEKVKPKPMLEYRRKQMFVTSCKTCKHKKTPIQDEPCATCRVTGWEASE